MKKLLLAALLLSSLTTKAETVGDTLVIKNVDKVSIETTDNKQHITVKGASFSSHFKYDQTIALKDTNEVKREFANPSDFTKVKLNKKNKKGKRGCVEADADLYIGLGAMTGAPSDYSFRVWPSWEVALDITANWYPFGEKNCWKIGFGIDWRRYRMSSDKFLYKDCDEMVKLQEFNHSTQHHLHSSIDVFSLQIPVLYTHTFDRDGKWDITLGGFVNFNTSAHANIDYTTGNYEVEENLYGIGQRPVTVDFMVAVKTPYFLKVYCKYSPTTFFKEGRGPKMHQLNFGVCF